MWLYWESSHWVSCSSCSVPTEKKKKKTCCHVVESHTAFISWRLWPTSHWFSNKKSVSFTFPLGQTGQVKWVFFFFGQTLLLLLQMTQANTCAHSLQCLRCSCVEKYLFLTSYGHQYGHQRVYMLMLYFKTAYSLLAEMSWTSTNINYIKIHFWVFSWCFNELLQMSSCLGIHLASKNHFGSISTNNKISFPSQCSSSDNYQKSKQTMKNHQQKYFSWLLTFFSANIC